MGLLEEQLEVERIERIEPMGIKLGLRLITDSVVRLLWPTAWPVINLTS